jgi:protein-S-isoprenylcysteine O-methyltransferase Ste14
MYAGALVTLVGISLALGPDEERFLKQNLPGYADYQTR